ncbi:MAG: type I methionyl aminopeptidase [Bacteroidales bacterium]|nr:type I methionyl aminopeptidase [Bacteroidales bacterium]
MVFYKSQEEIEKIRNSSLIVAKALAEVAKVIKIGVSTKYLDKIAEEFILDNGAVPAFKGYRGFPATLCVSINEEVVHGIPGNRVIENGDIVSVDCGVLKEGYYGDSAYTFSLGNVNPEVQKLLEITKESLYKAIDVAVHGKRLGDIGFEVQTHVEKHGFSVVRDLVGHGIGKNLHEKPNVLNYGQRGNGMLLKEGLVIAIEPMINLGTYKIVEQRDKWTIKTMDNKPSAHFEHTIAVGRNNADILSSFKFIEDVLNLKNN